MNTTFIIKLYADAPNTWEVDLGRDVLAGMTDEEIRADAVAHRVVKIQAKIRSNKKVEDNANSLEKYLANDFPQVAVGVYVARPSASKLTAEQMLAKILSGEIVLTAEQKAKLVKLG